jgi:hypothetical protein
VPTRLCLGCGRFTPGGRSYCPACSRQREKQKVEAAPWLRLYKTPEWQAAKWAVHQRDDFRCTFTDARGRCTTTSRQTRLEAHHIRKVRELWHDAGKRWPAFLELACDQSNLVSLCYRHHLAVEKPGSRPVAKLSARPLTTRRR